MTLPLHALIVEDEPVAGEALRALLTEFAPELTLEPSIGAVAPAIARLAQTPAPALVFMDVHLADGLCFEIFDALPPTSPVIFTTAYDQFALQAFEAFGIDYLLKPIRPARLATASVTAGLRVTLPSSARVRCDTIRSDVSGTKDTSATSAT